MNSLTGFVLAGGKSHRMGTNKALLSWGDGTLLDHMKRTIGAVANTVQVVGFDGLQDRHPDRGPVEGIATGLATTTTVSNLFVAVDLPYIETEFLKYFISTMDDSETGIVRCTIAGQTPLCLGIESKLCIGIDHYLEAGGRSVHGLFHTIAHDTISEEQLIAAGFSAGLFKNINTPNDYSQAQDS